MLKMPIVLFLLKHFEHCLSNSFNGFQMNAINMMSCLFMTQECDVIKQT